MRSDRTARLRPHRFWLAVGAVTVAGAATAWFGLRLWAADPTVAHGRQLYDAHCASCHGLKLEGQPDWQTPKVNGRLPAPPHDENGHTWHHSDRELFLITKKGMGAVVPGHESDMPAFEGMLADQEIEAVLAYIRSTWPERARRYQDERSRADAARQK